jgi:hypothetical protein
MVKIPHRIKIEWRVVGKIGSISGKSSHKNNRHNITEILLKVALNTINPNPTRIILLNVYVIYTVYIS